MSNDNVVHLFGPDENGKRGGSYLCSICLYRESDGTISSELTAMPNRLIETTGHDVPSRVAIVSDWMLEGAANMSEQSQMWLKELTPIEG